MMNSAGPLSIRGPGGALFTPRRAHAFVFSYPHDLAHGGLKVVDILEPGEGVHGKADRSLWEGPRVLWASGAQ